MRVTAFRRQASPCLVATVPKKAVVLTLYAGRFSIW